MTRLTMYSRSSIISRALDAFKEEQTQLLRPEGISLANRVYSRVIPLDTEAFLRSVPSGFIPYREEIQVNAQGWKVTLPFSEARPVFLKVDSFGLSNLGPEDSEETVLCNAVMDWAARLQGIEKRRESLRSDLRSLLNGFKNWREMKDGWPEGEPFWGPSLPEKEIAPGVPAVTVKSINEALGLPKS